MTQKTTVYAAGSPLRNPGQLFKDILHGIWQSGELTWVLFLRDLRAQYRESYFGYLWLIAPPLTTMLVWVFLNAQKIVRVETEIPYPLFVLIGTTVWTSFASAVSSPLAAFTLGKPVFMKLNVPPEAFILSGFLRSVFDLAIRVLLLVPVFFIFKFTPPMTAFLFPIAVAVLLAMAFAIGLTLIPLGGFYGDVTNSVGMIMGVLMFTVPIVYPVPSGDGILASIMRWNPLTAPVSLCRDSLTNGDLTYLVPSLVCAVVAAAVIFASFALLRIAMPHLVARMGM